MIKKLFYIFYVFVNLTCKAEQLRSSENQFTFSLFSKIDFDESKNFVFSPYCIYSNLALLYFGAENTTANEIRDTLHLSEKEKQFLETFHKQLEKYSLSKKEAGYQISIGNGIFLDKNSSILTSFQAIAEKFFEANVQTVDFANPQNSIQTINHWIEKRTDGKISSFLQKEDVDKTTKLLLANAVYFQGDWAVPFDERDTKLAPFYFEKYHFEPVNMMHSLAQFSYIEDEQIQGVILPFYRTGVNHPRIDCLLLLPKEHLSIEESKEILTLQQFLSWEKKAKKTTVEINVPKFCYNFRIILNDFLKDLGMEEAFTDKANFSHINGMKNLYVQRVIHDTFFSFKESGVTAASTSTTHIGMTSIHQEDTPILFTADRPFFFLIYDHHAKTILFLGHVQRPSLEGCDEK